MEKFKELSIEEMQEVDGGTWLAAWGPVAVIFASAMLVDMAMNTAETIETFKKGFNRGYEDGKN
ncbi:bacteriocin [Algoriphagus namhaensis]